MKLENQVTSLEPSRYLQKLGVKQESQYYWCNFGKDDWRGPYVVDGIPEEDGERWLRYPDGGQHTFRKNFDCMDTASAFTVAELDEILSKYGEYHVSEYKGEIAVQIVGKGEIYHKGNRADARAKMLGYLIENNLITL